MTKRLTILPALLLWTAAASAAGYEVRMNGAAQQVEPFKHYHYVTCAPEGAAEFTVTFPAEIASAEVSPLSRGIEPSVDGRTARFRLPETGPVPRAAERHGETLHLRRETRAKSRRNEHHGV